ncbi:MAG: hypothetical protein EON86_16845, partial [Brevundimonas sp.]
MQDLLDFGQPQTIERLFVGLRLPAAQAAQAAEVRRRSQELYGLKSGRSEVSADRLHVTLIHIGDFAGSIRADVAATVSEVLAELEHPSFVVSFDRVGSFGGAPGKHPHV